MKPGKLKADKDELRILILEDVESDAQLVQYELRKAKVKFQARCVDSRNAFLLALDEFKPDLILSDYSMPQFDAMDALHVLKERRLDLPFILVTGSQSEEVAVQCMKEGVDDYMLKSSLVRLPEALKNTLKKKEAERARETALSALRQSEEHFRLLIENALDLITILNPNGTFRYASPSVERVLGYHPNDLVGMNCFEMIPPDEAVEVRHTFQRILQVADFSPTIEFRFKHSEGHWCILEAIAKRLTSEEGAYSIVVNARDITGRKQAEAEIQKLATFPRLYPNPIFELNATGALNYFNQAAQEMARSLEKEHPSEILPGDTGRIVKECLGLGKNNLRRGTVIAGRTLSWLFFPITSSQTVHCYAFDITDRLNLEAQLRQSQRMDSIGQLAAGVAHDFNNILTVIQGYTGMLISDNQLPPGEQDQLKEIANAAERATNLTRQLLMFSRKQVMQPQLLDLNQALESVGKLLRRILGENIDLQFNYAGDLASIEADAGMIEQIILNLAVNARDAMARGGTLTLETQERSIDQEYVESNPEATTGHYVCLKVSDTGQGMAPEVLRRIFEPFFTTKEVGKGTGLGLATVYGIVKQHNGWIKVSSQVAKGTVFEVFLPASERRAVGVKPKQAELLAAGGSERILVVEDEPELLTMVKKVLKNSGYDVLEATTGAEALEVWGEHANHIDLLLTDMVMPGHMTGLELAEKLRAEKPALKVIYTSGYSVETVDKKLGLRRGVNFLQKPYPPPKLAQMVRDALDKS